MNRCIEQGCNIYLDRIEWRKRIHKIDPNLIGIKVDLCDLSLYLKIL